MIKDNDSLAVGLSGGKDSIVLLWFLNQIRLFQPIKFTLKAITLDPCFYNNFTDYSETTKFCERLGVEHIIERHPIWEIVFNKRQEKNPCSLCSRMRHGILHKICIENNCSSIALGHNLDDVVETFFMNLFMGGRISTFSPVTYLSRKKINMIRPLIFCTEDEIYKLCKNNGLPICKSLCPKDKNSSRENIKLLIKNLECSYPKLKEKVINSIEVSSINGW